MPWGGARFGPARPERRVLKHGVGVDDVDATPSLPLDRQHAANWLSRLRRAVRSEILSGPERSSTPRTRAARALLLEHALIRAARKCPVGVDVRERCQSRTASGRFGATCAMPGSRPDVDPAVGTRRPRTRSHALFGRRHPFQATARSRHVFDVLRGQHRAPAPRADRGPRGASGEAAGRSPADAAAGPRDDRTRRARSSRRPPVACKAPSASTRHRSSLMLSDRYRDRLRRSQTAIV